MPKGQPTAGRRKPGAGRPSKHYVGKLVRMPASDWKTVDRLKGPLSRGEFLALAVDRYKAKAEA